MTARLCAGVIRPDAMLQDLPMVPLMLGAVVDAARDEAPDLWRRMLALLLDGLRAEGQPRAALAPTVALDTIDRVMADAHSAPEPSAQGAAAASAPPSPPRAGG